MTLSLTLHFKYRPYYQEHLNTLETYSHIVALVTLYTGMLYVTSDAHSYLATYSHLTHPEGGNPHWFFFTFLLVPNLFFVLYWIYYVRLSFLKAIYERLRHYPKVFRILAC